MRILDVEEKNQLLQKYTGETVEWNSTLPENIKSQIIPMLFTYKFDADKILKIIIDIADNNTQYRNDCINLIASENVMSHLAQSVFCNSFVGRYSEGEIFNREYEGNQHKDEIEFMAIELTKKLFDAGYVDLRPLSGSVANICVFTGLRKICHTIMSLDVTCGGHITHSGSGILNYLDYDQYSFPYDYHNFNIDKIASIHLINQMKPDILLFGASLIPLIEPVKEILDGLKYDPVTIFDAAHVLGLIAGEQYPNPFHQGIDIITSSTQKTFFGPPGGLIMGNLNLNKSKWNLIKNAIFPTIVSNDHGYRLPAMIVALCEMKKHGKEYATQIIKNTQALNESMLSCGTDMPIVKPETHQTIMRINTEIDNTLQIVKSLAKHNIILNKNILPGDRLGSVHNPSGIRLGTQEMTRYGMKEEDFKTIGDIINQIYCYHKNLSSKESKSIKSQIIELRSKFQEIGYSMDVIY